MIKNFVNSAKLYLKLSVISLFFVLLWIIVTASFAKSSFVFEIIVSFLPYIWYSLIFSFFIGTFILFITKKLIFIERLDSYVNIHILKVTFYAIFICLISIVSFQIYRFAYLPNPNFISESNIQKLQNYQKLKLVWYNKYITNKNFTNIADKINSINPDVIFFTEVSDNDFLQLQKLLSSKYMYFHKSNEIISYTVILSKYEFGNINISKNSLDMDVVGAQFKINDKNIDLFGIHTTAPIDGKMLNMRNNQLQGLSKYFDNNTKNVVLLGDFNVTPWSRIYNETFTKNFINIGQGQGINNTWHSSGNSLTNNLIKANIDHIFITANIFFTKYVVVPDTLGSDHHMLETEIYFK